MQTTMQSNSQTQARKFAEHISEAILGSEELRQGFRQSPNDEHKLSAPFVSERIKQFLQKELSEHNLPEILFDFEGNPHRTRKQERTHYTILGTSTFPDSAIIKPFRCAFEFDRELNSGTSEFKNVLMKASVHVLSGAYDACVLFFVLKSGNPPFDYLGDKSPHTRQLIATLKSFGLYVCFV
jgi:hypothetical protein